MLGRSLPSRCKVTKKREKNKENRIFFFFRVQSKFGEAKVTDYFLKVPRKSK